MRAFGVAVWSGNDHTQHFGHGSDATLGLPGIVEHNYFLVMVLTLLFGYIGREDGLLFWCFHFKNYALTVVGVGAYFAWR